MNTLTLLADSLAQNNFGDTRTGGLAGPMGLFLILVLVIGTVLLIRNMNSRLRRLPDQFPSSGTPGASPAATEPKREEHPQP
ncbi:hypothetical protein [Planosporangium mesophilum]|uniref:Uncharacterized protein n=1 Tax=Planosporangium mesophilum TaxID=689768 RepID=A0A8J3TDI5_9ACTN|nr:hypothetical protein [Planosporangium mesophilum]NJC84877.1 hypothetical protein [Planosporangium mesophilum]GII23521.1 hypothetical protein Pme01_31180 [Planosporangium mesophilum]